MTNKKIVNYPIRVPIGDYCWNDNAICEFFDNEGGHPTCDLRFHNLEYITGGKVKKSDACINLKEECK